MKNDSESHKKLLWTEKKKSLQNFKKKNYPNFEIH